MNLFYKTALRSPLLIKHISPFLSSEVVRSMLETSVQQGKVEQVDILLKSPHFIAWNDDELMGFAETVYHCYIFPNGKGEAYHQKLAQCLQLVLPRLTSAQNNHLFCLAVEFVNPFFVQQTLAHSNDKQSARMIVEYNGVSDQLETIEILAQKYDLNDLIGRAMMVNNIQVVERFFPQCSPQNILDHVNLAGLQPNMYDLLAAQLSENQKEVLLHQVEITTSAQPKRKI